MNHHRLPSADQIVPGLWVGNAASAHDHGFLETNRISVIINCTKEVPFTQKQSVQFKHRMYVHDNLDPHEITAMALALPEFVQILNHHMTNKQHILVHCHAGVQRSATLVLAYLFMHVTHDYEKALHTIRATRPRVFTPMMNFGSAIQSFLGSIVLH